MLQAAVSFDIDTLHSIYKGVGCRRSEGYTYAELGMGLENLLIFLDSYGIKATLFMVGSDFLRAENHGNILEIIRRGHEIANHTMTHAQGFRSLSSERKEYEIAGMEDHCLRLTGQRPLGFRSPGWNIDDDALPILHRRGYLYDSSVFPTLLMPLMKGLHWYTMRGCSKIDRTTMGRWRYMMAPHAPYRTKAEVFSARGDDGIVEFPVTVDPLMRLPFFATFLLSTGLHLFQGTYRLLKAFHCPVQFQFHLSDFVDYGHTEFSDQIPRRGDGVYIPKALRFPLRLKLEIFHRAMDRMAGDYSFSTLAEWAAAFG